MKREHQGEFYWGCVAYWGRVVGGAIGLFIVIPSVVRVLGGNYSLGVYIGTGIVVLWYTVETYYLRRAMVRANEIAVLPLVIAGIESVQVPGVSALTFAEKVVLRNLGKSTALGVRVADFDVEKNDLGIMGMRIEGSDVIEVGQTVPVESFGYLEGDNGIAKTVDTLVPHLRPTAQKTHDISISYEDIAGGKHNSVMRMGKGGIRLLRHS